MCELELKQAQICAEGCEGKHFTQIQILLKNIVKKFCVYIKNVVKILYKYLAYNLKILYKYCIYILEILYK